LHPEPITFCTWPRRSQPFRAAETFICPGVERKCAELKFDWLLGDTAPDGWHGQFDQVLVRGSRWIGEVAFFHRDTRPKPAPEYQWGWRDKPAARESLRRILQWPFERVIVAHGDLIESDVRHSVEQAWKVPLTDEQANREPIA